MKEIKILLKEFTDLISISLCIACIILSGFMILINLYHYQEIRYEVNNEYMISKDYNSSKIKIANLKDRVNNVKENNVIQSDYFIYSQTKIKLESCLNTLQESKFYNMNDATISSKDLYDFNNDIVSTLQYKCLFEVDYAITSGIDEYKSKIKYNLSDEVNTIRTDLMFYGDNLRTQMLSNGSYHYSTTNSKVSIYNQTLNYYNLTINNYEKLLRETEKLVNWFTNEFGR